MLVILRKMFDPEGTVGQRSISGKKKVPGNRENPVDLCKSCCETPGDGDSNNKTMNRTGTDAALTLLRGGVGQGGEEHEILYRTTSVLLRR